MPVLAGTKVAEVVMSAEVGTAVELLAVTNLDARGRELDLGEDRTALPLDLPYDLPA